MRSANGAIYFVTLFDECSGYSIVCFLNGKRGASEAVKETVVRLGTLFNSTIGPLHMLERS